MNLPEFDPVFPIPLIASLAGGAALFTLARALFGKPLRQAWLQLPVVFLRLIVIALLAVILLNPVRRITRSGAESTAIVLLDRSASMKLPASGETSRWDEAKDWVSQTRQAAAAKSLPPPALAVFDEVLETVSAPEKLTAMQPQGRETRLAGALLDLCNHHAAGTARQLVIVSDGCAHDRDEIQRALSAAAGLGMTISTRVVGTDVPPRNAWIAAVNAPRTVLPKSIASVRVDLGSSGLEPGASMRLVLREAGGKEVASARVRPDDGEPCELTFEAGMRSTDYEVELVPLANEAEVEDNRFAFTVEVTASKLRVLFVEGTHVKRTVGLNGHWWNDMELMTRAWDASGEIEYECLTPYSEYNDRPNLVGVTFENGEMRLDPSRTFPRTRDDMYRFDVMLISDVPVGNFSEDQMQWVVDWVGERGGGFLMGGGYTTFDVGNYDQTPWERIVPADMVSYGAGYMQKRFPIRIPDAVKSHPLWKLSDDPAENERILATHPGFLGMNRIKRAKPGATVLAVRADVDGDEPVIAAQNYGRGRSVAWLPDPNGGWAREYVKWGPPGGPPHGPQTELGHGSQFRFDKDAAKSATGEAPPHPSPHYGQYWVNLVKWLGANSIRWHRERLAGRIKATSATPGKNLPVAAEVLTVTQLNDLLALDVGARLTVQGSPRVRLSYDRDAREFTGEIPIPPGIEGDRLQVSFDVNTGQAAFTDTVSTGIRRSSMEFTDTAPDKAFMEQLAHAAGGVTLDSPESAVAWLLKDRETRQRKTSAPRKESRWPVWPVLAVLISLLCLEWAIRRRAGAVAAAMAVIFLCPGNAKADNATVAALIEQLAAPKVRLRDEAQDQLAAMPEAHAALKKAAKSAPSEEARLRAAATLAALAQNRWTEQLVLSGHADEPGSLLWSMLVDEKNGFLFTRANDGVRQWDLKTLKPGPLRGRPVPISSYWANQYPLWSLAITPEGKSLVSTDDAGALIFSDILHPKVPDQTWQTAIVTKQLRHKGNGIQTLVENHQISPIPCIGFSPDGRQLIYSDRDGRMCFKPYPANGTPRVVHIGHIVHTFTHTPDGKRMVLSVDQNGEPDYVQIRDAACEEIFQNLTVPNRPNNFQFDKDGKRLICSNRDGAVYLWHYENGTLTHQRTIAKFGEEATWAILSGDDSSVLAASSDPKVCISEWDLETGEILWMHPPADFTVNAIALLPDGRLAGLCSDLKLRIWIRSPAASYNGRSK